MSMIQFRHEHELVSDVRPSIESLGERAQCHIYRDPEQWGSIVIDAMTPQYPFHTLLHDFDNLHYLVGEKGVAVSCLINNCREILQCLGTHGVHVDTHEFYSMPSMPSVDRNVTIYRMYIHHKSMHVLHGILEACDRVMLMRTKHDTTLFSPELSQKKTRLIEVLTGHIHALYALIKNHGRFQQRLLDILDDEY